MMSGVTRDHWHVNIRKFVVKADHPEDLVRLGTLTRLAQDFLAAAVVSGLNILVAGGTQAGNTRAVIRHDPLGRLSQCRRVVGSSDEVGRSTRGPANR